MKKLKFLLAITLAIPALVFGAAGDIKIDRKNSSDNAWIVTIFAKQNSALLATDSSGVPTIITTIPSSITWNGGVIAGQYGGTGVANTGKTVTLGGNLITSGAFNTTFTVTANTNVTLPTTGTLAALGGTNAWTGVNTFSNVSPIKLTTAATDGIGAYATEDVTTNYARIAMFVNSSIGWLATDWGGSGTPNYMPIRLSVGNGVAGSTYARFTIARTSGPMFSFDRNGDYSNVGSSLGNIVQVTNSLAATNTSGTIDYFAITPTYNQATGTAVNTDFKVNRTPTAVGSGLQKLGDFQTSSVTKFAVLQGGLQAWAVTSTATAASTTTLTALSSTMQIFTGSTTQTIQMPAASVLGSSVAAVFTIKNRSSGTLTVNRAGSDTIDGATSDTVVAGASKTYISNGSTEWVIN